MPRTDTLTVARLTAEFFGSTPPERHTAETVREALARQIAQCHAMITYEFDAALNPDPTMFDAAIHDREYAYERVDQLAATIGALTRVLQPPPPDADAKRHVLKIEVERRTAPPPAAEAPAFEDTETEGPDDYSYLENQRHPNGAYWNRHGTFDAALANVLARAPERDVNEVRAEFGYASYTPSPLPPR